MRRHKILALGLLMMLTLSCVIMGCADKNSAIQLYEKVAEFLPAGAITNIEEYQVMGDDETDKPISYAWAEKPHLVVEGESTSGKYVSSQRNEDGTYTKYLYDRALVVNVDNQENMNVCYLRYYNDGEETGQPSALASDKEKRDAYVQKVAKTLLANGEQLIFTEVYVSQQDDMVKESYYTHTVKDEATGNMIMEWVILLNCYYGDLSGVMQIDYIDLGLETRTGIAGYFEQLTSF